MRSRKLDWLGYSGLNKQGLVFTIVDYIDANKIKVVFEATKYEKWSAIREAVCGSIRDNLHPIVANVGFIGDGKYKSKVKGEHTPAYKSWRGMINRCYDPEGHEGRLYMYKNVEVYKEWYNYQVFAEWFEENYIEGCVLDKDIKSGDNKMYSPDTCSFVTQQVNALEGCKVRMYNTTYVDPYGKLHTVFNKNQFGKDNNLCPRQLLRVASGETIKHKGWTLYKEENNIEY